MAYFFKTDLIVLLIQAVGALLLAALCIALLRTVQRPALRYWSIGWVILCVSLQGLYLATYSPAVFSLPGQVIYLLGEYTFGYMVFVGCRRYVSGEEPKRSELWLLVPAAIWCVWLSLFAGGDVNLLFAVHTLVYSYIFFRSLRVLGGVSSSPHARVGVSVMKLALFLLTIDYLHYAPLRAAASYQNLGVFDLYLTYAPLYDLIFQVMLAFGMVMTATGRVQEELEAANADLKSARDRLETTSRMDPLTSALNRRAFSAVLADRTRDGRGVTNGVVAVVDLDGLKALNDELGHAAGDAALLALAEALRACIGPEDLLFRWGGDEFVVLLKGERAAAADQRLGRLNEQLASTTAPGLEPSRVLRASVGISEFADAASLHQAIDEADRAMYTRKKTA
ncbi:MAG TPA: GGDEF domain-containing protein [Vicinamibacterales bacterium]|nr:GGDEF domain-containing protein [Vicinamibacterales bacterium]